MIGKVVWFNVKNGYGFVRGADEVDYFAHFSKIIAEPGHFRLLQKGDTVEFEAQQVEREAGITKPQALNIKVVEGGKDESLLREEPSSDFGRRVQHSTTG